MTKPFNLTFPVVLFFECVVSQQSDPLWPEPSGPYVTGVRDFEFTDVFYEATRPQDADGRRIMVRAWYPACSKVIFFEEDGLGYCGMTTGMGRRRLYFEEGEFDETVQPQLDAFAQFISLDSLYKDSRNASTWSFFNSPSSKHLEGNLPLSVLVFSPGGLSMVGQSTALMEEIASYGWAVFSVTHPGELSGIRYPNGDTVTYDDDYYLDVLSETSSLDVDGMNSPDINKRFLARKAHSEDPSVLAAYIPRWADDLVAFADFLEQKRNFNESTQTREFLIHLVGPNADLKGQIVYGGMSFGGAAASSAAQKDPRSIASWNLDGTHQYKDLLGTAVRVPLLYIGTELNGADPQALGFTNEFFWEPLATMGSDPRVVRLQIDRVSHFEVTDIMFVKAQDRTGIPRGGTVNGTRLHEALSRLLLEFMDFHTGKDGTLLSLEPSMDLFPEFYPIEVVYVADWWAETDYGKYIAPKTTDQSVPDFPTFGAMPRAEESSAEIRTDPSLFNTIPLILSFLVQLL